METFESEGMNSVKSEIIEPLTSNERKPEMDNKSKKVWFLLGFLLGVIVVMGGLTAYVYNRPINDPVVRSSVNILPYPAVVVNGEFISIKDYLVEYDALLNFFADQTDAPSADQLVIDVMDTVINKKVLEQLADQHGISLDVEQVEAMMEQVSVAPGGEEAFNQQLADEFGWTLVDFKERVVNSLVLSNQMTEYVSNDNDLQQERKAMIKEALERLNNGDDFLVVAGDISEDSSAKAGGDIGFVPMEEMIDPWLSAIVDLKIGEISGVVESAENFMIFKVTDAIEGDDGGEVQLSVITVNKLMLDSVLEEFLLESEITRYIGKE